MTRRRSRDDTGAALLIALIFITVVSTVTAALFTFTDSSIRTTIELSRQASDSYRADGATEIAINTLRNGTFTNGSGTDCGGSGFPLTVAPFSTTTGASAASTAASMLVTCERRPETSGPATTGVAQINSSNTPSFGLLSLGTSPLENGVSVGPARGGGTLQVTGTVGSNSTVNIAEGTTLTSDSTVYAYTSCPGAGTITAPLTNCSGTSQAWPKYPAPTADVGAALSVPTCPDTGGLVTFTPGLYTDSAALNACDRSNITMWFKPGTYYFNFPAKVPAWQIDEGALVGGTPTGDIATKVPVMPGSCISPLTSSTPDAGVQFVFGGPSQWVIGEHAQVELCGSYSPTSPPVAINGLTTDVGTVPEQSNCIVTVSSTAGCSFISSTMNPTDTHNLYVQGTVYALKALVAMSSTRQGDLQTNMFFNDGLAVRSLTANLTNPTPSSVAVPAFTKVPVMVPDNLPEVVVLLSTYECPATGVCTASTGRLRLKARVGLSNPPTGAVVAGRRAVSVYSWAVQR